MIVQKFDGRLLLVQQADHGIQSGRFGAGWGNEAFAPLERREQVVEAANRHDNGWVAWDTAPTLDEETGQPLQFFKIRRHEHVSLYRLGIREAAIRDPYVGLMVSMHGAGLYNDRYGTWRMREQSLTAEERALVEGFLAEQEKLQRLLAGIAVRPDIEAVTTDREVWLNYKLVQVWDRLSLQYLLKLAESGEISPVPVAWENDVTITCENRGTLHLALDPYPFADDGAVFPVEGRLLPDRRYATPEDLFETYLRTPVTVLECRASRA